MGRTFLVGAVLIAMAAAGCGGSSNTNNHLVNDSGTAADGNNGATDTGTPADGSATGSTAGSYCTTDSDCGSTGALTCQVSAVGSICSANCINASTQAAEQAMCGGAGSTCLTDGIGSSMAQSLCTSACVPSARTIATGACPAGQVCTGLWFDSSLANGMGDSPGCFPFCTADSQCGAAGAHCNTRTGFCGASTYNATGLADGSACDPTITVMLPGMATPVNNQCRGQCLPFSATNAHQGICGSFINLRATTQCPDNPTNVPAEVPSSAGTATDDFAICNIQTCTTSTDCASPLQCLSLGTGAPMGCIYPTPTDGGVSGDAG